MQPTFPFLVVSQYGRETNIAKGVNNRTAVLSILLLMVKSYSTIIIK